VVSTMVRNMPNARVCQEFCVNSINVDLFASS
jgi:hypothetical protein